MIICGVLLKGSVSLGHAQIVCSREYLLFERATERSERYDVFLEQKYFSTEYGRRSMCEYEQLFFTLTFRQ